MLADIFGPDGLIVLLVIVVVLFGSTQLPKLARSLGSAQSEFKKGLAEGAAEQSTPAATSTSTPAADSGTSPPASDSGTSPPAADSGTGTPAAGSGTGPSDGS